MRNLDDVSNELVVKQKALQQAISDRETIAIDIHTKERDILDLRSTIKDLTIVMEKAKSEVQRFRIDVSMLNDEYWKMKQGL